MNQQKIRFFVLDSVAGKVSEQYIAAIMRCAVSRDETSITVDLDSVEWAEFKRDFWAKGKSEAVQRWTSVKPTWAEATEVEQWSITRKITSLIKSLASRGLLNRRVSPDVLGVRDRSCHGNTHRGGSLPPCPSRAYSVSGKFHYCNDCGCGEQEVARISQVGSMEDNPVVNGAGYVKLMYPSLQCPRAKPGFSNAATPPDRVE